MIEVGDKVQVRYGVLYKGTDLTDLIGIVKSSDSYLEVYFGELNLVAKLFRYEVDLYFPDPWDEKTPKFIYDE